ncbi:MAG: hypothetical protein JWQ40_3257 [Segetibacter sp.]|nr:hypothetical protein [Segetibacter sp.]
MQDAYASNEVVSISYDKLVKSFTCNVSGKTMQCI